MKKWVLLIPLFLAASGGYAQWTKGHYVAGARISFSSDDYLSTSSGTTTSTRYDRKNISVGIGKLLRNNLAAGAGISYGWSEASTNTNRDKGSNVSASLFVTRYLPIAGRFSFEVGGALGYSHGADDHWANDTKTSSWRSDGVGISVSPGLNFRMSRHLFLNGGLAQILRVNYSVTRNRELGAGGASSSSRDFTAEIGAGGSVPFQFGLTALF